MQMSRVGFAGNAADPNSSTPAGAVPYNYSIGTYDVTYAQYAEFLNAKASAADPYGLWNSNMDTSHGSGWQGITRSGSGPYTYAVAPGYANKPVAAVTWYDAVRFVNWLQNGQGDGDTESGTYMITGGGNNSGTVIVPTQAQRQAWALAAQFHWLLPSEDEWYKAAYFNGARKTYYTYPFQSNTLPTGVAPPGGTDTGNFIVGDTFPAYNSDGFGSHLTDVGSYPKSISPFGTYDMGGDVWQWSDKTTGTCIVWGSSWDGLPLGSDGLFRDTFDPTVEYGTVGFRVASVPEPGCIVPVVTALCGMAFISGRRV
jgi:formylglycine-generating enzyme required for sulfatase activity